MLKSPKTKTLADRLIERTSSMLNETENHAQRQRRRLIEKKDTFFE